MQPTAVESRWRPGRQLEALAVGDCSPEGNRYQGKQDGDVARQLAVLRVVAEVDPRTGCVSDLVLQRLSALRRDEGGNERRDRH